MNWYKKSQVDQIYSRYDVIQSRDDLAPSRLRPRKRHKKKHKFVCPSCPIRPNKS